MNKISLPILIIIGFYFPITSQNFWVYTAGGIKEDEAMDICYDNSSNIISAGYFISYGLI